MSIMILSESTLSMLIPLYSFVLQVTELLKTKILLESLILTLKFYKLVFKGLFLL